MRRKLEEVCKRNVVFMALSADTQPHFTTIAGFVADLEDEVVDLFHDVLVYCDEEGLIECMRCAVNESWCRPTLGYRAAVEVWQKRPAIKIDRAAFREEVRNKAAGLINDLESDNVSGPVADFAERLAIEQSPAKRGLLTVINPGGVN